MRTSPDNQTTRKVRRTILVPSPPSHVRESFLEHNHAFASADAASPAEVSGRFGPRTHPTSRPTAQAALPLGKPGGIGQPMLVEKFDYAGPPAQSQNAGYVFEDEI